MIQEHRLYTFVASSYLSDKQKGIQSLHVVGNMLVQLVDDVIWLKQDPSQHMLYEWASSNKTVIMLGAHNSGEVQRIWEQMNNVGFPKAIFAEDVESLGGAVTACGIVLPMEVWKAAEYVRKNNIAIPFDYFDSAAELLLWFDGNTITAVNAKLACLINNYSMA